MFVSCTILVVEDLMHTKKIVARDELFPITIIFFINYLTLYSEIRLVKSFIMY